MLELTPAEQEAWNEVKAAEQALEQAQLRLIAVTNRSRRQRRRHLRVVAPGKQDDPVEQPA